MTWSSTVRHVGHLPRHYCPSFSFGRVENGGGARREMKVAANGEGGGGPSEEELQESQAGDSSRRVFFSEFGVSKPFFCFCFYQPCRRGERERDFSSVPPVLRVHIIIVGILSSSATASGRLDLALFSSLIRELAERKRVVARSGHVHVGVGHLSGTTHVHIHQLVPEPGKLPPS